MRKTSDILQSPRQRAHFIKRLRVILAFGMVAIFLTLTAASHWIEKPIPSGFFLFVILSYSALAIYLDRIARRLKN